MVGLALIKGSKRGSGTASGPQSPLIESPLPIYIEDSTKGRKITSQVSFHFSYTHGGMDNIFRYKVICLGLGDKNQLGECGKSGEDWIEIDISERWWIFHFLILGA